MKIIISSGHSHGKAGTAHIHPWHKHGIAHVHPKGSHGPVESAQQVKYQ